MNGLAADGDLELPLEDLDQGVIRRGVLGQRLAFVEREQGHTAAGIAVERATDDRGVCKLHELVQRLNARGSNGVVLLSHGASLCLARSPWVADRAGRRGAKIGRSRPDVLDLGQVACDRNARPRVSGQHSSRGLCSCLTQVRVRLTTLDAPRSRYSISMGAEQYRIEELIGSGGMGSVYRAIDQRLDRAVALKFLNSEDPELVERFLREARLQASVDHPTVCTVYEVGEMAGKPFIAMQLLEAPTLTEAARKMNLEQKVRLVRDVADGVHAAHRLGLVHRDLKPGNILVRQDDDGVWRPSVVDFGLAREQADSTGLTRSGVAVGTAAYMAPEQALGAVPVDRRADIFSLGCVLYELLSGAPPFTGGEVEVLMRVATEEPAPLRKRVASVPRDLETVVMRCLERRPEERYGSSRELAEELDRFLDGVPVEAKPPGAIARLARRARRHRTTVGVGLAAMVIIVLLIGAGVRQRMQSTEQARVAHRLGQHVERIEGFLRYARALPLHDIGRETEVVRGWMAEIRAEMQHDKGLARGPSLSALGRGYLALDQPRLAEESLHAAWESGYREPEVALALGQARIAMYEKAKRSAERISNPELRSARLEQIREAHLQPALDVLALAEEAGAVRSTILEGRVALHESRLEAALDAAERACEESPWDPEALKLTGEIHLARAQQLQDDGQMEEALTTSEKAGEAFALAVEMAPSDAAAWEGSCQRWVREMDIARFRGEPIQPPRENALEACGNAVRADSSSAPALTTIALVHLMTLEQATLRSEDVETPFAGCMTAAERALQLDPTWVPAQVMVGRAQQIRAWRHDYKHGGDPRPRLREAVAAFRAALELDPDHALALAALGTALAMAGEYEVTRGLDPRESLRQAAETFERALEVAPEMVPLLNNAANMYVRKGEYELEHGLDPEVSFARTTALCERAVAANPAMPSPYNIRGVAEMDRGLAKLRRGESPADNVERAIGLFEAALERNPSYAFAKNNIGHAWELLAEYQLLAGEDPTDSLNNAEQTLEETLEMNPEFGAQPYQNLAHVHQLRAEHLLANGGDPTRSLDEARHAVERGIEVNPNAHLLEVRRAAIELVTARGVDRVGQSPREVLSRARRCARRALELKPSDPEALLVAARVERMLAEAASDRLIDGKEALNEALELLRRTEEVNPAMARAILERARVLELLAELASDGSDAEVLRQAAVAARRRALESNPLLAAPGAPSEQ